MGCNREGCGLEIEGSDAELQTRCGREEHRLRAKEFELSTTDWGIGQRVRIENLGIMALRIESWVEHREDVHISYTLPTSTPSGWVNWKSSKTPVEESMIGE